MTRAMEMDEKQTSDCDHKGQWVLREIDNGMGVKFCEGCGHSEILAQLLDGQFAWMPVKEYAEAVDDLAEAMLAMRAGAAEQPLCEGEPESGRPPAVVSAVQAGVRREPEGAGGDEADDDETLRQLSGTAPDLRVLPQQPEPRRLPELLQTVQARVEAP